MNNPSSSLPPLPYNVDKETLEKARQIKLALFDVDGVLTDGKLHYHESGEYLKVFHALDGHGLKMLQQSGIAVGIITARNSAALKKRMTDLKIQHCFYGANDKAAVFNQLLEKLKLTPQQCSFMGDDVIDMPVMSQCGLTFSPANGHFIVQHNTDWVSPLIGGNGAVRSVCDILLYSQDNYPLSFSSSQ